MEDLSLTNLDIITSSIVKKMGSVGLFHYNKLTFLFEYFFIKNFGRRFTNEPFVKLPHGPVISNYKSQIEKLVDLRVFNINKKLLNMKRSVDDFNYQKILIKRTDLLAQISIPQNCIELLLDQIIKKYSNYSVSELERIVYKTPPMKKYLSFVKAGFKKEKGGYILRDCIKISRFKSTKTEGRRIALKHLQEHPYINFKRQKELTTELEYFSILRPKI